MKIKFLIVFVIISSMGCKRNNAWTQDYKKTVKDSLTNVLKFRDVTNVERSKACDCWINDLEKSFPNKLPPNGIPMDTMMKVKADCCIRCLKL